MLENLKILREEKHMSQAALASMVDITQQAISEYENCISEPSIEILKKLADLFETSVDYLIGYTDIRRKLEPVKEFDLNTQEENHIRYYRKLSKEKRQLLDNVTKSMLE